jgi:hypothetical protein
MQFMVYCLSSISPFFIEARLNALNFCFKYALLTRLAAEYRSFGYFFRHPSIISRSGWGQVSGKEAYLAVKIFCFSSAMSRPIKGR